MFTHRRSVASNFVSDVHAEISSLIRAFTHLLVSSWSVICVNDSCTCYDVSFVGSSIEMYRYEPVVPKLYVTDSRQLMARTATDRKPLPPAATQPQTKLT